MKNFGANSEQNTNSELFRKSIENLSCEEFDGHTDFEHLSAEDRLHWLSEVARFFYEQHKGKVNE